MINPIAILAFGAMNALPPDASYVFRIPVRIENMRHITEATVSCAVVLESPSRPPIAVTTTGGGLVLSPLRDGGFTDTVTVTVTVPTARLGEGTPARWECNLIYRFRNPDGTIYSGSTLSGEREAIYTRLTGQEITTAVVTVSGTLTPP